MTHHVSRREFLAGAGGLAVGAATGGLAVGASQGSAASSDDPPLGFVPFPGAHQAGITVNPVPAQGLAASFTVVARDRAHLQEMFRELTEEIRGLMAGVPPERRDSAYPPTDSGILGPRPAPDDLSIIVSVGASLFDGRYGLAAKRPRELVEMPFIANDRLDPARSHGDLLLIIQSQHTDHVIFALRQLMRRTRREMTLKWVVDGFNRRSDPSERTTGSPRNLLGFVDGTANLHTEAELMDRYVWTVGGADGEPAWTTGGSYQVVRVIRMLVEFWDRTPLAEQEALIGRQKATGAPLDGVHETDVPDFAADPTGTITPLDAHIRLANPRTAETRDNLILRRGFSYTRGYDGAGQLDQGLAFVSYQTSIETGFLAVQRRLNGEPLEEYIRPEGGGYFFALPGLSTESGYLGEGLFGS